VFLLPPPELTRECLEELDADPVVEAALGRLADGPGSDPARPAEKGIPA